MRIFLKVQILLLAVLFTACQRQTMYPSLNEASFTLFAEQSGFVIDDDETVFSLMGPSVTAVKIFDSLEYEIVFDNYHSEEFAKEIYQVFWKIGKEEFETSKMYGSKRTYGNMQSFTVSDDEDFMKCTRIGNTVMHAFGPIEFIEDAELFFSKTGYNFSGKK
ncbi:MAG: hypothetical protein LUF90_08255 [Rikenellaceae bacterium]|nr:hypothetical protein [Rikenellaceae bacterium]